MDRTSEPNIPIASIAKIGLQIAAAIQTYVQAFDESDRSLADVAINIYNSASALEQLRKLIDEDESARTQQNPLYVLKDEGRTQIEALAAQCHRLYNAIIDFVSKARRPGQEVNLSGSHPETISFTASSISETLKWRWLDPRIERCQKLLKWLEINLAFVLQLALLARFQIRYPNRDPGTFEEESALRQLAVKLRSQRLKHAKDRAREQRESREAASSLSTHRVSVSTTPTKILSNKNFDSKTEAVSNMLGPGATSSPIKTPSVSAPSVDNSDKETCVADPEERIHIIANSQDKVNSDKLLPSKSPSLVLKTKVQKRLHIFSPGSSDSYDWKGITPNTVENSLLTYFKRKLGAVTPLLQRIFWRGSRFTRDWESTELEAYIVHEKGMEIRKLFLGHKRLNDELNRALQRDGPTLLDRYTSLDSNLYMQINKAIFMAKCQDLRQRTIIAIHHYHGASNNLNGTVLFFSLGTSTEPIHLTDCIGRPYDIPYEHGGSWDLMHNTLTEAFNGVEDVAYRVRRGHYDILLAERGLIVPRGAFGAIVKPGSKVFMKMWPPSTQMPRRIGPPMPSTAWGRPWHHPLPGRNTPLILRVKPLGYKDIENDIERMGIQINFEDEVDVAKRSLGDTLTKLTNATDHVGEFYCKAYDSDSDGDSVSSGSLVDGED